MTATVFAPRTLHWWLGHRLALRPLIPDDLEPYRAFLARVAAEDLRLRTHGATALPSLGVAKRLVTNDGARNVAFAAVLDDALPEDAIVGVVRAALDPSAAPPCAEFAILVRSDVKGRGLGKLLLERLIEWANDAGIDTLVGETDPYNERLLGLARSHGFVARWDGDAALTRVTLTLRR